MPDVIGGNLVVNVKAALGDFQKKMGQAQSSLQKFGDKAKKAREGINKAGKVVAAAGAVMGGALIAATIEAGKFGDTINKMSLRTGESAETLSGLAFAAERSGTNLAAVENGIKRVQRNLSDAANGLETASRAFSDLDINIYNADGSLRKASDVMVEFAEKTAGVEDSSKKAALAQELFGRAGTQLLPLFAEGADGMRELMEEAESYGIVIDDVAALQGAELVDSMSNLKASMLGATRTIGNALMPGLTALMNTMAETIAKVTKFASEHKETIVTVAKSVIGFIGKIVDGWVEILGVVDTVMNAVLKLCITAVSKIYNAFKWVLDKLGIEMPDLERVFESIGDEGESTADRVRKSWNEFKDNFAKNLEEQEKIHDGTQEEIEARGEQTFDFMAHLEEKRTKDEAREVEKRRQKEMREEKKKAREMLKEEKRLYRAIKASYGKEYGEMLDDIHLKHAAFLQRTGADWEGYLQTVIKERTPTVFDKAFEGIAENFDKRIDQMGDMWMQNVMHGRFKDSFDFMGEYLVTTIQGSLIDLEKNVLKLFFNRVKQGFINVFKGKGGFTDQFNTGLEGVLGKGGSLEGMLSKVDWVSALKQFGIVVGAYMAGKQVMEEEPGAIVAHTEAQWQAGGAAEARIKKAGGVLGALIGIISNEQLDEMNFLIALELWNKHLDESVKAAYLKSTGTAGRWAKQLATGNYPSGQANSPNSFPPDFFMGGVIPGILGQRRLISAHAGEEVITRQDPRHQWNMGGLKVIITGNNINSELEMDRIGKIAADRIFSELKMRTRVSRF